MEESPDKIQGVLASSERLLKTVLAIAQNRLELLLLELREECCRLFQAALLLAAVVVLGGTTLVVVTFTVVVLFWENHRLAVLAGFSLLYFLATLATYWRLRHRLKHWTAFAGTRAELEKDKACLDEKP
ncbi:MAG: phage holin family protein [Limisphaerales bacterium]